MKTRNLFLSLLLALFTMPMLLSAQETAGESGSIEWIDLNNALKQVEGTDRKVLVDFYTDWCGWCKRMDRDTYTDSNVIAIINQGYIAAKFNPEKSDSVIYEGSSYHAQTFARAMGVRGYPATGFINADAEVITLLPGYMNAEQFALVLQFISDNLYESMTFEEYTAQQKEQAEGSTNK